MPPRKRKASAKGKASDEPAAEGSDMMVDGSDMMVDAEPIGEQQSQAAASTQDEVAAAVHAKLRQLDQAGGF